MNIKSTETIYSNDMATAQYILEQSIGYQYQAALRAAALLNIADHLEDGPKTVEQLAIETNTDAKILKRLLIVLATKNIFTCSDDSRFALTPEASFLTSNHPYSLRQAILTLTDKTFWLSSGEFIQALYGKRLFEEMFGDTFYDYWKKIQINLMASMKGWLLSQKLKMNLFYNAMISQKIRWLQILPVV